MFLSAALSARLSTRCRTHTLDLTGIKPSVLGGTELPEDWLVIIIDRLPNLQSLIIHDLSAFDYRSLKAFNMLRTSTGPTSHRPTSSLRLLTASLVGNAVSSALAAALIRFPALVYLDLSSTKAVNKLNFLEQIASINTFPSLEILKLRNIGLTNDGLGKLAVGLGTRVWSLDVRRNQLTDAAVPVLLKHCFLPDDHVFSESYHDEQMQYMGDLGPSDDEVSVVRRLAKSSSLRQHRTGITHLYISDNDLSLDSAKFLIKSWRLTALDLGKFKLGDAAKRLTAEIYQEASAANAFRETVHMQMTNGARLRYLRVDHSFVTGDAFLLEKGISAARDMCSFWPSGNWDFMTRASNEYDKDFPGQGLHTLVLSGLPNNSDKGWITKTLLAFLGKCNKMEKDIRSDPRAIDTEGHPSSILRRLHLEMPESSDYDQLEGTDEGRDFLRAVDLDFSFFQDEESPERDSSSSSRGPTRGPEPLTEEEVYQGDIVARLKTMRKSDPTSWTGRIVILRPLGPAERDSLLSRQYTIF